MNIVMMTNTYLPHVGGVAKSVAAFTRAYRKKGHNVLVVRPEFPDSPDDESGVIRVPAIQNFNGSDFSVALPAPLKLAEALDSFKPDIIHSHHPFLLGDTALRLAASYDIPLIFNHHTRYEEYTHYVPADSANLKRYVVELVNGYCELAQHVIAPSESIKEILEERGVTTPISVIPTGVETERFLESDSAKFRKNHQIPEDAYVVGHVGRLAPEKNIDFLSKACLNFLKDERDAYLLVVGSGPPLKILEDESSDLGLSSRVKLVGQKDGQDLIDAYHAMNVFAFTSQSETQGMVLTEALAAGVPLVSLPGPGVNDVLQHEVNGLLVDKAEVNCFSSSLRKLRRMDKSEEEKIRRGIKTSLEKLTIKHTAKKALECYQNAIEKSVDGNKKDRDFLLNITRRIDTEWQIWSNRAESAAKAAASPTSNLFNKFNTLKQKLASPGSALLNSFFKKKKPLSQQKPGFICIQIDGLAFKELNATLKKNRMPFLAELLSKRGFRMIPMYSGLPSSTPAVQAELFYGQKTAVPAFAYMNSERNKVHRMFDTESAREVEEKLEENATGLLLGGSSYSNIYSGGASKARYCASSPFKGRASSIKLSSSIRLLFRLPFFAVRVVSLLALEFIIAFADLFRGIIRGRSFLYELRFIIDRVAISLLLRELITFEAKNDIKEELPAIHLNYLGYDEQAHHRGPSSYFAHWTLKGIDKSIKKLWQATQKSNRHYYFVVYSDHGQEHVIPYEQQSGNSLKEKLENILNSEIVQVGSGFLGKTNAAGGRTDWINSKILKKLTPISKKPEFDNRKNLPILADMGPLAHLYIPNSCPLDRDNICQELVSQDVPLVVQMASNRLSATARTGKRVFSLPDDLPALLSSHAFSSEISEDFWKLCCRSDSGDFILFGHSDNKSDQCSFSFEYGSHGGLGPNETKCFCLLPPELISIYPKRHYLRPNDLRDLLQLACKNPDSPKTKISSKNDKTNTSSSIRVMTYNIHSCVGTDRRISLMRIAQVLDLYKPDLIALQEVDVGLKRTGMLDQAKELSDYLGYSFEFMPSLEKDGGLYGIAILSRFPMHIIRAEKLSNCTEYGWDREPRCAVWAQITIHKQQINLVNTHLAITSKQRKKQALKLLGSDWLGDKYSDSMILCGDFNAGATSSIYRMLSSRFQDVQKVSGKPPTATWRTDLPVGRIDHIFVSNNLNTLHAFVPKTKLTKVASDHFPVISDISLTTLK